MGRQKITNVIEDGVMLFTNKQGTTFEPTTKEDGNFEYTCVRKDAKEFVYTLSKPFYRTEHQSGGKSLSH